MALVCWGIGNTTSKQEEGWLRQQALGWPSPRSGSFLWSLSSSSADSHGLPIPMWPSLSCVLCSRCPWWPWLLWRFPHLNKSWSSLSPNAVVFEGPGKTQGECVLSPTWLWGKRYNSAHSCKFLSFLFLAHVELCPHHSGLSYKQVSDTNAEPNKPSPGQCCVPRSLEAALEVPSLHWCGFWFCSGFRM